MLLYMFSEFYQQPCWCYTIQMTIDKTDSFFSFLQMVVTEEIKNLRRLEAQRNELNAKGKFFTTFFEDRS